MSFEENSRRREPLQWRIRLHLRGGSNAGRDFERKKVPRDRAEAQRVQEAQGNRLGAFAWTESLAE